MSVCVGMSRSSTSGDSGQSTTSPSKEPTFRPKHRRQSANNDLSADDMDMDKDAVPQNKDGQPRSLQKTSQSRRRLKSEGREKDAYSSRATKGRIAGVFQPCRTSSMPPLPNVPSPVSSIVSAGDERVTAEAEVPHLVDAKKNLRMTSAKSIIPSKTHEDDVPVPIAKKKKKSKKKKWSVTAMDRSVPKISLQLEDVENDETVIAAREHSLERPLTPRPTGDIFPVVNVLADPQVSDTDALEVPGKKFVRSVSLYSSDDSSRLPSTLDDTDSRLSFIVREKLHVLAKKIHRRTSDVKQHIRRPPTPENDNASVASTGGASSVLDQHRRSLMSFIGFSRAPASSMGQYDELKPEELERLLLMSPARRFWELHIRRKLKTLVPSSIDPHSKKYLAWLAIVTVCFLYNAYAIPLRCAYPYQTPSNVVYWMIIDYICDAVYLLDLFFIKPRLRFMRGGLAVKEKADMRRHYLISASFKLDVLSLLPFDVLYIWLGCQSYLRTPRILKFMCFGQFFSLAENWVSNAYIIRISKTLSYMLYIIHCNSCVFYSISAWQAFGQIGYSIDGQWYQDTWVYNNEGNAYIHCFFYTTKLATSIGNNPGPVNVIEYFYMTFSWLMGVFVFALLLGQISDIVSNANRNQEQFRNTMDAALSKCSKLQLPEELQNRVRDWFNYTWDQQKSLDENRLISRLPLKLQTDLALSVHYNTLSKVQLFIDCDRALLRDLVLKLKPVIFLPGDFICKKGEVGKEMYIVNKGILEVVGGANNETVFAQLKEGSVFGEISLLAIGGNNRRTANIRSKGYSNLFVLSKDDLNDVIKDYPEAQQMLKRKARKMLRNDEKAKEDQKRADMESFTKTCEINAELETPKMLKTVAKVLNPNSNTSRQLNSALEHSNRRASHSPDVWSADSDSEIEELIRTVMGPRVGARSHSPPQQHLHEDTQSDHE